MKVVKKFVEVIAKFDEDGIMPVSIHWSDGRVFYINQVLDVRPAASIAVGGLGIRYTCRIGKKETFLFYEEPRWFVEVKNK